MNPILTEKELEHDLQVIINEFKSCGDAWGQHPAISYTYSKEGWINLRNLVAIAVKQLSSFGSEVTPIEPKEG